jgi:hypothetical protein
MASTRLGLLLLAALATGCAESGPEVEPVRGRVTLDGRPLASADVVFQPDDMKRPGIGLTDADGRYELIYSKGTPGARVGQHTVRISFNPNLVKNPPTIPDQYNTTSELRVEVKAGEENVFDFALMSDAT